MLPANAVTNNIEIRGEPFSENIISSDIHEISEIPLESPSNPSIKLIAFVIPTIHKTVIAIEKVSSVKTVLKKGKVIVQQVL